jgi:phospholipid:diacylglycerol acyltransferase
LDIEFGFRLMSRADHVDILGATPLNEAIVKIAAGRGDLVTDQIDSGILEYVEKMKWD